MKLKRLLCALVVFTLMMTSVVCSVSAATYQTATKYDLSAGAVYLETTVNGLTPGSMVSYIIYDNEAGTGVANDGSNIEYIDQQTASSNGTLVFGSDAKFESDAISDMAYTFASSGSEHTSATYEPIMQTNAKGQLTDVTANVAKGDKIDVADNVTFKNYFLQFLPKSSEDFAESGVNRLTVRYNGYRYADSDDELDKTLRDCTRNFIYNSTKNSGRIYVHPSSVVTFEIVPEAGKEVATFNLQEGAIFNGASHTLQNGLTDFASRISGNTLKFDLSEEMNGEYFNVGAQYVLFSITSTDVDLAQATYIKIDGNPIYEDEDEKKGVTFLMTKSDLIANEDTFGVNVYAYPVGSKEVAAEFKDLQAFDVTSNKFGIQLVIDADDANAKYFDATQYKLVAVPYYGDAELASTGSDLFYTTTDTELSGSYNN